VPILAKTRQKENCHGDNQITHFYRYWEKDNLWEKVLDPLNINDKFDILKGGKRKSKE
jgi:hypothetical protein